MAIMLIKRGLQANIQNVVLAIGELALATDTGNLYVGTEAGNHLINPSGGTADVAKKLQTSRAFSITGDGTAPIVNFDGTANVQLVLTLASMPGLTAGTFTKLTVDAKGRVTAGAQVTVSDISGIGALASKSSVAYDDLAAALKTLIDGKAGKATTLSGYGITDAYTKAQVDGLVAGILHFKGTKDYVSQLPSTGNVLGDVWLVKYSGTSGTTALNAEYLWDGTKWEDLGSFIDLSAYVTNAAMQTALNGKVDKVSGKGLSTNDLTDALLTKLNGAAPTSHASSATTYGVSSATNYGHAKASATTPKAAGTAAVGSEVSSFARGDHIHPSQTTVSGNAGTATKLQTARTIALSGGATGSASFDGSANTTIAVQSLDASKLTGTIDGGTF